MNTLTSHDGKLRLETDEPVFGQEAPAILTAQAPTAGEQTGLSAWSPQLQEEVRLLDKRLDRLSERSKESEMRAIAARRMRLEAMNAWSTPAPWQA